MRPITLGELYHTLELLHDGTINDLAVEFEDGTYPRELISWRGRYAELSLVSGSVTDTCPHCGQTTTIEPMTLSALLTLVAEADGATFEGYAGGGYTMGQHTPVWADEYGSAYGLAVVGVKVIGDVVVLLRAALDPA